MYVCVSNSDCVDAWANGHRESFVEGLPYLSLKYSPLHSCWPFLVERRRRYNINDRIKELGLMLPKSTAEDMKLNKGTILKASCDYIRQLQRDREIMVKQQQQQAKLEDATRQYMQRIKV